MAGQGAQASSRLLSSLSIEGFKNEDKDDRLHSDEDVAAYAQAVASGARFVEKDSHKKGQVEEAEA